MKLTLEEPVLEESEGIEKSSQVDNNIHSPPLVHDDKYYVDKERLFSFAKILPEKYRIQVHMIFEKLNHQQEFFNNIVSFTDAEHIDKTANKDMVDSQLKIIEKITKTTNTNTIANIKYDINNHVIENKVTKYDEKITKNHDNITLKVDQSPLNKKGLNISDEKIPMHTPSLMTSTIIDPLVIPKFIFQTHKSLNYVRNKPKIMNALNTWRKHINSGYKYKFFTDEQCQSFMETVMIKEDFGRDLLRAYNKVPLAVMKADLWRYCIIYEYGGIYADADALCMGDINIFTMPKTKLIMGPENNVHYCQWTFSAPPKSPVLKHVILLAIKRILNTPIIKGEHIIHELTGPGVWTDGINSYYSDTSIVKSKDPRFIYNNKELVCLKHTIFHKVIGHLFAGQDADGWCQERDRFLK